MESALWRFWCPTGPFNTAPKYHRNCLCTICSQYPLARQWRAHNWWWLGTTQSASCLPVQWRRIPIVSCCIRAPAGKDIRSLPPKPFLRNFCNTRLPPPQIPPSGPVYPGNYNHKRISRLHLRNYHLSPDAPVAQASGQSRRRTTERPCSFLRFGSGVFLGTAGENFGIFVVVFRPCFAPDAPFNNKGTRLLR